MRCKFGASAHVELDLSKNVIVVGRHGQIHHHADVQHLQACAKPAIKISASEGT